MVGIRLVVTRTERADRRGRTALRRRGAFASPRPASSPHAGGPHPRPSSLRSFRAPRGDPSRDAAPRPGVARARAPCVAAVAAPSSLRCHFASGSSGQRNLARVPIWHRYPRSATTSGSDRAVTSTVTVTVTPTSVRLVPARVQIARARSHLAPPTGSQAALRMDRIDKVTRAPAVPSMLTSASMLNRSILPRTRSLMRG